MGIQGLTKLLTDNTKTAVREVKFESYFGRKVAIDASMHIYQFMVSFLAHAADFARNSAPAQYVYRSAVFSGLGSAPCALALAFGPLDPTLRPPPRRRRPSSGARASSSSRARPATSPGARGVRLGRPPVVPTALC